MQIEPFWEAATASSIISTRELCAQFQKRGMPHVLYERQPVGRSRATSRAAITDVDSFLAALISADLAGDEPQPGIAIIHSADDKAGVFAFALSCCFQDACRGGAQAEQQHHHVGSPVEGSHRERAAAALVRVLRNGTEAKLLVNAVLERCNGGEERLAEEDRALLLIATAWLIGRRAAAVGQDSCPQGAFTRWFAERAELGFLLQSHC